MKRCRRATLPSSQGSRWCYAHGGEWRPLPPYRECRSLGPRLEDAPPAAGAVLRPGERGGSSSRLCRAVPVLFDDLLEADEDFGGGLAPARLPTADCVGGHVPEEQPKLILRQPEADASDLEFGGIHCHSLLSQDENSRMNLRV